MPIIGNPVNFSSMTESEYKALPAVDVDTVYFLSDKNIIILGNEVYSGSSDTWKYIGHFDSITDTVPVSYLTYDGLDKTNYACTVGDTNMLYVLDTSVETPEWIKAFDNLVTSFDEYPVATIPYYGRTNKGYFFKVTDMNVGSASPGYAYQFGVQDTFDSSEVSNYGGGPYYLSKYPDPSSIVVEFYDVSSPVFFDFKYDKGTNSIVLSSAPRPSSSSSILRITYLQKFSASLMHNSSVINLESSLFYYLDGSNLVFTEPPAKDLNIYVSYQVGGTSYNETWFSDGETTRWSLEGVPDGYIIVIVDNIDYTYYIIYENDRPDEVIFSAVKADATSYLSDTIQLKYNLENTFDNLHVPTAKLVKDNINAVQNSITIIEENNIPAELTNETLISDSTHYISGDSSSWRAVVQNNVAFVEIYIGVFTADHLPSGANWDTQFQVSNVTLPKPALQSVVSTTIGSKGYKVHFYVDLNGHLSLRNYGLSQNLNPGEDFLIRLVYPYTD